jgi:hypothetical protein
MFARYGFVVVMYKETKVPLALSSVGLLKILFETRHQLFESLFIDSPLSLSRIEMDLVNAFSKEPRESPARYAVCNLTDEGAALGQIQVYVGTRMIVILLGLSICLAVLSLLKP